MTIHPETRSPVPEQLHLALRRLTRIPHLTALLATHPFYVDALAPAGCCRAVRRRTLRGVGRC